MLMMGEGRTPFFSPPSANPFSPWSSNMRFKLSCAKVNAPPTYVSRLSSKSSRVSSKNGFLELCLMLYIAMLSFRPWKLLCDLISAKAFSKEALEVSVGKDSRTADGLADRTFDMEAWMESGRRARRATARLPWEGEDKMRAIPEP